MDAYEKPPPATLRIGKGTKPLPHIPTELLFLIIDNVPADHILPFRTICRSIRTHIDTSVFNSYLHRMSLIGYASHFGSTLVTFKYSHKAKSPDRAVFQADPDRLEIFEKWSKYMPYKSCAKPEATLPSHWIVQLDHIALELDTCLTTYHQSRGYVHNWVVDDFDFQDLEKRIVVNWKLVLCNMLVWEVEISRRTHAHEASRGRDINTMQDVDDASQQQFAYGRLIDHIRATRREYLTRYLDRRDKFDWQLWQRLYCLRRPSGQPKGGFDDRYILERTDNIGAVEDATIHIIMRLRRSE